MNITLNTNNFNAQYNYKNNRPANTLKNMASNSSNIAFTSVNPLDAIPSKSKFLAPFKRGFDKFTTGIAEYYTIKLYTSPIAKWLAKHTEKLGGVVDHMQVAGSVIISGMYMQRTLTDKSLDDDRKKTLAINQGLTFGLSTLGSYLIDNSLDNIWEKFTQKYAAKQLGDKDLPKKIKALNDNIISKAEAKFGTKWKNIKKKDKPGLVSALKYIEENVPNTGIESKIRGMGVLKKLVVFGTVYRFLSPVFVTPFAPIISEKLMGKNKANKTEQKQKTAA